MNSVACGSKIPVAHHRRQPSPERKSPPRRKESPPSKIPTNVSTPSSPPKVQHSASFGWSPSSTPRERPQSIDIEDEFKSKLQYGRFLQQIQQAANRSSNGSNEPSVTSPSRIPIAASGSSRKSSVDSSPTRTPNNGSTHDLDEENERLLPVDDRSSPSKSKIPTLRGSRSSSPPKAQSTSPSKSQLPFSPLKESKLNNSNSSSGNSLNRMHSSSSPTSVSSGSSTSRSQRSGSSGGATDSATEQLIQSDDKIESRSRKKQYEAFVMTGDRMINLAKTPANSEFITKTTNLRASGGLETVRYDDDDDDEEDFDQDFDQVAIAASSNAKSDRDQKSTTTSSGDLLDHLVDQQIEKHSTNEDEAQSQPKSKEMSIAANSSKKSIQRKTSLKNHRQTSVDSSPGGSRRNTQSPDLSTSSLISSEHYNGESLLDQDNLSPRSSSSPDTPEWSLIDSYHKQKSSEAKQPLLPIASDDDDENRMSANEASVEENVQEEDDGVPETASPEEAAIISEAGNRVIITIGNSASSLVSNDDLNETPAAKPNISSTNINTPMPIYDDSTGFLNTTSIVNNSAATNFPSLNDSSEESDLESLRSFHPPPKAIDVPSALRLAKRLYHMDGFKRTDVARHLGKNNEFSQVVAEEYLRYFDFSGSMSLDMALRCFLQQFCLTGETQERERVLLHFSRRYLECNPEFIENPNKRLYRSLDAVHTLSCAILLLNTDLHGESVSLQRKMSCNEFIENLSDLNDGQNFPRDLLRAIYYAIKDSPLPWATVDDQELEIQPQVNQTSFEQPISKVVTSISDYSQNLVPADEAIPASNEVPKSGATNLSIGQTGGGINPFLALPDPSLAVDYKKGYVMRKCCLDPNGKKTKLGKRSWRMYFVTLRDMVLFCFKDEKALRQPGAYEDFSAAIRIHHGLAVRATDYVKKQFVFRLHTSDQAEYLFQTSDEKELLTWIDAINYVVASFSARVLGTPCSSGGRFQRPLLPSSKSSLNMADQLASHESQLQSLRREIEDHLQNPPPKHAKANVWQNYKEKQEFLKFEIMRYETYILTLRTKNAHDT